MNKKILPLFLLSLIVGCETTAISSTFVQAVKEHRQDTYKVNDSLVAAMTEQMEEETQPEAKEAYWEIINNLNEISNQADILYKHVWGELTEDELAKLLKSKWRPTS